MLTSALIMTTMEPSASPATCRKTPFMLRLLDPAVAGAWVGAARTSKAVAVASATIRSVRSVAVGGAGVAGPWPWPPWLCPWPPPTKPTHGRTHGRGDKQGQGQRKAGTLVGWLPGRMTTCVHTRDSRTVEQCHANEVDAQTNGADDQNQAGRLHGCRHNNRTTTQESARAR